MAATAVERIVVRTTLQAKKAISAKAKRHGLSISELMRRGATAYESDETEEELGLLADKVKTAIGRASESIEDVLSFVEASNARITEMETKAAIASRKGP
ncbi:MAG: hypothetical protein GY734_17985 [Herbaspirillum sp.]|nr:hypothetical protein [Herbaspirillum sp.]MCP3947516.1 hypothetical protein [Herbaspirillum sp.]MCP3947531.1 hypothetical protein [Herbaspirillum sp.]MCP4033100.1 hypothetical protein [Herbaspirillum sp.]MCP4556811.1 hypothetical protein [Herbaspirillum sp.]